MRCQLKLIQVGYLWTSSSSTVVRVDTIHRLFVAFAFLLRLSSLISFLPFNDELRDQMKLLVLMLVLVSVTPARMA